MLPVAKVHSFAQNPNQLDNVGIGFKDTLLQIWDLAKGQ